MKKALIIGITGQDGSYLAQLLIQKGYEVHGVVRRSSSFNTARIDHLYQDRHADSPRLFLHFGDLSDGSRLVSLIGDLKPDEIYNLGAQSHVRVSFDEPEYTGDVTGLGTSRVLEAVRLAAPGSKYYQASSSEMFGATPPPQNETTPFYPRSPYGAAKVYAYWMTKNYREAYGMFAVNGILFNHESPRRGETFVTRKITRAVARIKGGVQSKLYLGNLDAVRDWGYAPEYVEGMWRMMQHDEPMDFVLATGQAASSEMFGATPPPQHETTPFYPRSPYGAAKVYAYWMTKNYREAYGMFAVNGILFNHESPRRGQTFVTRKISRAVARIKAGVQSKLYLGNLDAVRDWGYAPEYVEGMWRMLQHDVPMDFVLATGQAATVKDFLTSAFSHAGLDWQEFVQFDPRYLRPTEVDALIGDSSLAEKELGWKAKTMPDELARLMVEADIQAQAHAGSTWIDSPTF